MQSREQSFSLLEDDNEQVKSIRNAIMSGKSGNSAFVLSQRETIQDLLDSESDDADSEPQQYVPAAAELSSRDSLSHVNGIRQRIPSAGPSGRQTVTKIRSPISQQHLSSDSESENSDNDKKDKTNKLGEYDPNHYQNLDVSNEIKDLFQYITKYIPQNLNLDFKFKPFIPDFIPAIGDIDAFLKIVPPDNITSHEPHSFDQSHLGLTVLDEPSANQSDPALLHLQLRASSINISHTTDVVIKKVENVEKSSKTIDKWIKDINDLHRSKSSPIVKYSDTMPDLDDLMQQWPEGIENLLKIHGFPNYKFCDTLPLYIKIVCCIFDIPIYKNKIQSLHLLFSLYAAIKNSQLYQASNNVNHMDNETIEKYSGTDQLLLE